MRINPIHTLTLAFLVTTAALAEPQTPIPVTVLRFYSPTPKPLSTVVVMVPATLTADLSADPRFIIVERSDLRKILDEAALGLSGNISADSAAKIGRLTGAKVLVSGHVFKDPGEDSIVIVANVVGTETGRIFAKTAHGPRTNTVALLADLSKQLAQLILSESSNLLATPAESQQERIARIVAKIGGGKRPAVMFNIIEQVAKTDGTAHQTVQTELGLILQKAGFAVVDDKSDKRPDVVLTGNALASDGPRRGGLFSARAILELKAQERTTGKILTLETQQSDGLDVSKPTAARKALEQAADGLAERLLPVLAE
jgi:hypothetical protein